MPNVMGKGMINFTGSGNGMVFQFFSFNLSFGNPECTLAGNFYVNACTLAGNFDVTECRITGPINAIRA
jgi:hypothetical protein